ncbi:hypothetical protein NP493_299g03047 [Ridgeia piscesae]|uniref:C2H2-type domain-containing protein n=1 Tax=Ridgeia piscesae TaxID=27915 RepID=A0AAD9L6S9_RIDPI|nr:hypothetical protein NP493_299g03047 [Ridgeia piscesae]
MSDVESAEFGSVPSHTVVKEKSPAATEASDIMEQVTETTASSPVARLLTEAQPNRLSHISHKDKYILNVKTSIHKCHLCNYKTTNRSSLRSHYAVHSTDRPYACDMCMYEAKRLNDLRKHKLVKHGKRMPLMLRKGRRKCSSVGGMLPPLSSVPSLIPILPEDSMYLGLDDASAGNAGAASHTSISDSGLIPSTSVFPEPELQNAMARRQNVGDGDVVVVKSEPDNYSMYQTSSDEQMNSSGDRFIGNCDSYQDVDYNGLDASILREQQRHTTSSVAGMSALNNRKGISNNLAHAPVNLYCNSHGSYHRTVSPYTANCNHTARDSSDGRSLTDDSSHHGSLNNHPVTVIMKSRMRTVGTDTRKGWHCRHCDILFFDSAIYFMHMGLHSANNVWQCNLCSEVLSEVYSFTSHFINEHSDRITYSSDIDT